MLTNEVKLMFNKYKTYSQLKKKIQNGKKKLSHLCFSRKLFMMLSLFTDSLF
jgi:hypothetical protein